MPSDSSVALPWWAWAGFLAFIGAMLALDLGLLNRRSKAMTVKKALVWCGIWLSLALGFNSLVAAKMGSQSGLEFLTGYLVELCLSVDNVFVFVVIFQYFRVAPEYQHRVLFWGVVGALLTRAAFIFAGVGLINAFHAIIYVFGAFLVYTGVKLALPKHGEGQNPDQSLAVRFARRLLPVARGDHGGKLFVREEGRLHATALFIVLVVIETTDVMFALDSIPAVIAITRNEFIVFTSNIFAILGLRSLYFAVSGVMQLFRFLNYGLAIVLVFVGAKMLLSHYFELPILTSLVVIGVVLGGSIGASVLIPAKKSM
ncbi:MAG TPA: TerC family protein [Candidatus Didemnitutus sp.]|nr:TerC family protein [Candidatus Didemnitutus sp.]